MMSRWRRPEPMMINCPEPATVLSEQRLQGDGFVYRW
jgi:hypothetical protein